MQARPSAATAVPETSHPRLANLTGLRAYASAWVLISHFAQNTGVGEFLQFPWLLFRGAFGVDVFFVLSGVVITLAHLPALKREPRFGPAFRDYLARRLARIYPLHLATFLVVVLLVWRATETNYLFSGGTLYTPVAALLNLTLMQAWGLLDRPSWHAVSWSLSAEWFAYLCIFPVCVYLLERCTARQVALLITVLWVTFVSTTVFLHHHSITSVTHDGVLRILPEFMAGYLLCRIVLLAAERETASPRAKRAGLPLTAAGALAFWPITHYAGAWDLLVLPAVLLLIRGLLHRHPLVDALFGSRLAVYLGETSFALYMVHPLVQLVSNHIMRTHPGWIAPSHAIPILALEILACYLAASAVYHLFECPLRTKMLAWIRRAFPAPAPASSSSPPTISN